MSSTSVLKISATVCLCVLLLDQFTFIATDSTNSSTSNNNNTSSLIDVWWNKLITKYPKYEETKDMIHQMATKHPHIVKAYSVGQSVDGREMWVIQLTNNVTSGRKILKPMVKIVANMHGDETVGRQLILMLATHILQGYEQGDSRLAYISFYICFFNKTCIFTVIYIYAMMADWIICVNKNGIKTTITL